MQRNKAGNRIRRWLAVLLVALFVCLSPGMVRAAGETGGAEQGTGRGSGTGTGTGTGTGSSGGAAATNQGQQITIDLRLTEKSAIVVAKAKNGTPAMYYILMKEDGEKAPSAEEIRKNGTKTRDGYLSMPPVAENVEYIFYAVAEDSSGKLGQVFSKRGASSASRGIGINGHIYCTLQVRDEIDDCMNTPGEISINVGAGKAAKKIEYIIADKFVNSEGMIETIANEKQDVNTSAGTSSLNISKWSVYDPNRKPGLVKNMLNYVYVKITNPDDTVDYYSSRGIWEDETLPIAGSVTGEADETTAVVTVTGNDDESGIQKYYMLLKDPIDLAAVQSADVMRDGMSSDDGIFNLTGLTKNTRYELYAVVLDNAGNLSEVRDGTMSTTGEPDASSVRPGTNSDSNPGTSSNVAKRTEGVSLADEEVTPKVEERTPYLVSSAEKNYSELVRIAGWENIKVIINSSAEPADIFVDLNGGAVVPWDVLETIVGHDITVHFILDDTFIWEISGRKVLTNPQSTDLRVTSNSGRIPARLVNELAGVYPREEFSIEHRSEFGYPIALDVRLGDENVGKNAHIYYYNESNGALEPLHTAVVDELGYVSFAVPEARDFLVIVGPVETEEEEEITSESSDRDTNSTPNDFINMEKGSGNLWIIIVSVIAVLLFFLIIFLPRDKAGEDGEKDG